MGKAEEEEGRSMSSMSGIRKRRRILRQAEKGYRVVDREAYAKKFHAIVVAHYCTATDESHDWWREQE